MSPVRGYDPYGKAGRWYKFFIESDGSDITLTESDLEDATISGTRIKLGDDFHAIDVKEDIHSITGGTAGAVAGGIYIYADGQQAVNIPAKDQFDYATVYVFGYTE